MDRQLTQCFSGLQLLTQVIIADITSLRWRGLVSGLVSLPFLLNAFVGSRLAAAMIEGPGWRWGCKSVSKAHPRTGRFYPFDSHPLCELHYRVIGSIRI